MKPVVFLAPYIAYVFHDISMLDKTCGCTAFMSGGTILHEMPALRRD